jgi:hypothetical protein
VAAKPIMLTDHSGHGRPTCAAVAIVISGAVVGLEGQLAPLSIELRRAVTLTVFLLIAGLAGFRDGRLSPACWTAVITSLVFVVPVPCVSAIVAEFVIALAAIELVAGCPVSGATLSGPGGTTRTERILIPVCVIRACLTYVTLCFVADLVPRVSGLPDALASAASRYVGYARGAEFHLSFAAMGGPSIGLAVLLLLWVHRYVGGRGRLVAAAFMSVAWFSLLPVVVPGPSGGPVAIFWRGSAYGLGWLALGAILAVSLPPRGRAKADCGQPGSSEVSRSQARGGMRPRRAALALGSLAAGLAGVCLTGTALTGPAAGRSILVHNYGGLDWDRPVFGRFGGFSGGMFGLLPVYCRAEGLDFNVIDKTAKITASVADSSKTGSVENATPVEQSPGAASPAPEVESEIGSVGASPPRGAPPRRSAPEPGNDRPTKTTAPPREKQQPKTADAPAKREPRPRLVDTIGPGDLDKTQILVLINSPKVWDDPQRRTVLDFVARGGSLLVLGDHTDVFGLMRGFNSLLGPLGIRFRFDSAMKACETWRGCQAAAPDAVAWGWDDENPGVAVGASLELSGWARPLLVGRYAFSDEGVRENVIGSFLGNYHYDQGEQLGDVVLVATTTYGRGRVVVWGDTSAFQGVSSYWPTVVGPMFAWLSRPAAWTERPPFRIAAAIGLLAAIIWLWVVRGTALETAMIAASLIAGLMVPWLLSLPNMDSRVRIDRDVFLIDRSHMPASGHYEARVNPVGPLYTNLLRSGFRTADLKDWSATAIRRARGIAFVAPQRSFTRREIGELTKAEEEGAVVLLTTGEPDSRGSRPILEAHGLALAPRPLGTVTSADIGASRREREKAPRFLDAWPIVTASSERDPATLPGVEVIYRHGEDVVALFRRVGKGGLLLIADTRFFSDGNVEDMSGFWPGNLALIHDIFKQYLGANPDGVKPLFRSPEMPR